MQNDENIQRGSFENFNVPPHVEYDNLAVNDCVLTALRIKYRDHGDVTGSLRSLGVCTALLARWRHHTSKLNISDCTRKVVTLHGD